MIESMHFIMVVMSSEQGFQGHQVVQPPSNKCLAVIAKDLKFDLNDDELKEYQGASSTHQNANHSKPPNCKQ